ncbi:phosphatase PAP2 family protein [Fibrobacter sp. UWB11]|uniref:phosphatase PAP2 family protein n=1 Tax=Fibrobacter sp. UWB11 TaxID=1896202 RepID=UPI0015880675|nr:phosphatase PAP2 family protein [Fibrobacter sp. UWB11]
MMVKSFFRVIIAVLCAKTLVFSAVLQEIVKPEHHYEVSVRLDVPLVLGITLTSALGVYRYYGMERISLNDLKPKSEFLPWDRPFVGHYSDWATTVSHYSGVLAVAPLALAGYSWYKGDADGHDFGAFTLMFVEAFALQNAINQIVRSSQLWPRPYVYAKRGEGSKKAESARGEAFGSFYSGHSSAAFTVAIFTGEWFSEIYPNSKYKSLVWASSLTLAGGVAALRVMAGKHYPTDVVVGALVGTGVSLGVLKLHEICKNNISFWVIPGNIGAVFYF